MSFVLKTNCKNISVPLDEPEKLWSLKEFNPKLPLVMMITGWTTNFNDTENPTLDKIYAAYKCRGNVNFVVCTVQLKKKPKSMNDVKFILFEIRPLILDHLSILCIRGQHLTPKRLEI